MRPKFTKCCDCDRGGNGNAVDKCSCGWQVTAADNCRGCYCGGPIVGPRKPKPKLSRSKQRYRRYLEIGDCFESFRDFLMWESWDRTTNADLGIGNETKE